MICKRKQVKPFPYYQNIWPTFITFRGRTPVIIPAYELRRFIPVVYYLK